MLKISYAAYLYLYYLAQFISTQFAPEICLAAQNRQKINNTLYFWRSMSYKVIEFGGNQKPVYDFLLVTNSNLDHISHRY